MPHAYLDHLLRDLELLNHPDLVVHLDRALNQFHLCAVKIRKVELVDLKLLNKWREIFFLRGGYTLKKSRVS